MEYLIERGIPLLPDGRPGLTATLRQMAIGDSIVISLAQQIGLHSTLRRGNIKGRFTSRKISDTEVRVWRVG